MTFDKEDSRVEEYFSTTGDETLGSALFQEMVPDQTTRGRGDCGKSLLCH